MRVLAKVLVFPLVVILTLAGLAVRVFIRLGSVVLGVSALLLGILAFLTLINKMWLQMGILGLIFATMMIVMLASAELQVWIDLATESLKKV
ncbi:MAG: hypothetical protein K5851_03220 [Lachnospiraceae bacterium]|nr:hypothetical protein [Lachnospiraceae bacterium]